MGSLMNSEMKITNYDIIGERRREDLVEHVREKLYEGWQPYGKVIFLKTEQALMWWQPMVRMEKESPITSGFREMKVDVNSGIAKGLGTLTPSEPSFISTISKRVPDMIVIDDPHPMGKVPGISPKVTIKKRGRPSLITKGDKNG